MPPSDAQQAALAANEAFYRAFATRDLTAMTALWARSVEVACLHPGWAPLYGREAVMESWAGILGNPQSPNIRCLQCRVTLKGEVATVVCYEVVEEGYLVATNLFVREEGGWKLYHHQAGPLSAETPDPTLPGAAGSKQLH